MSSIMSSAQSSVASSTISGQPAATSSDSGSSLLTSQTTLYLYTFLVTLVVLFALTGGIIARSCMMRRRFRRRLEEAVRNGTVTPSTSRRPKVGEQPTLHDVWVKDVVEEDCSAEGSYWMQRIIPVAAMLTGLLHDTKATTAPTSRTLTSHHRFQSMSLTGFGLTS
ncbi:hypothetical protein BC629DRAFT_1596811 [Irpex lacteus]|nr:hypothetical protein BC629DRAFT_1596811 [Irpex lacteus]